MMQFCLSQVPEVMLRNFCLQDYNCWEEGVLSEGMSVRVGLGDGWERRGEEERSRRVPEQDETREGGGLGGWRDRGNKGRWELESAMKR